MKKLIAWLTKGSKIVKILKYVYAALVAANSAVSGVEHGLDIGGKELPHFLQKVGKYLSICVDVLEKILSWFGVDAYDCRAIANSQMEPEEIEKKIRNVLDEEDADSKQTMLTFQ